AHTGHKTPAPRERGCRPRQSETLPPGSLSQRLRSPKLGYRGRRSYFPPCLMASRQNIATYHAGGQLKGLCEDLLTRDQDSPRGVRPGRPVAAVGRHFSRSTCGRGWRGVKAAEPGEGSCMALKSPLTRLVARLRSQRATLSHNKRRGENAYAARLYVQMLRSNGAAPAHNASR